MGGDVGWHRMVYWRSPWWPLTLIAIGSVSLVLGAVRPGAVLSHPACVAALSKTAECESALWSARRCIGLSLC
jgi:hypothetical protein